MLQIKVFLPWNEDLVKALNSTVVYYNQSPSFSFRIGLYNITSIIILNILTWIIILRKNNVLTNSYINWRYHIQWICMYKMILNCQSDTPAIIPVHENRLLGKNISTLEHNCFWRYLRASTTTYYIGHLAENLYFFIHCEIKTELLWFEMDLMHMCSWSGYNLFLDSNCQVTQHYVFR